MTNNHPPPSATKATSVPSIRRQSESSQDIRRACREPPPRFSLFISHPLSSLFKPGRHLSRYLFYFPRLFPCYLQFCCLSLADFLPSTGGFFTPRLSARRGRLAGVCVEGMRSLGLVLVCGWFFLPLLGIVDGWKAHLSLGKDDDVSLAGETPGVCHSRSISKSREEGKFFL